MGASNAGGVGKNRDSRRIAGYRSMTGGVRTITATVHGAVYRTDRHASVNLCLSQPAWTTTTNRREQNSCSFLRSGKSEAEVTYCTIEANYLTDTKHRAASLRQQGCQSRMSTGVRRKLLLHFVATTGARRWNRTECIEASQRGSCWRYCVSYTGQPLQHSLPSSKSP